MWNYDVSDDGRFSLIENSEHKVAALKINSEVFLIVDGESRLLSEDFDTARDMAMDIVHARECAALVFVDEERTTLGDEDREYTHPEEYW